MGVSRGLRIFHADYAFCRKVDLLVNHFFIFLVVTFKTAGTPFFRYLVVALKDEDAVFPLVVNIKQG